MRGDNSLSNPKMAEFVLARFVAKGHKTSQTTPSRLYKLSLKAFVTDHRLQNCIEQLISHSAVNRCWFAPICGLCVTGKTAAPYLASPNLDS